MSRYRKAFTGLWVIIFVFVFVILGMHIFAKMHIINKVVKIKGKVNVYITLDDKGTESLTFLNSKTGEKNYMEVLGSLAAKDAEEILKDELGRVENTLFKLKNYYLIVRDSTGQIIYEKKRGTPTKNFKVYKLGNINIDWPVRETPVISSGFGFRLLNNELDMHGGIDIALPEGTKVYPAADGQVVGIGRGCQAAASSCVTASKNPKKYNHPECGCNGGLGNYVTIKHHQNGQTFYTFYDHLKEVTSALNKGDKVTTNTVIGTIGSTGYSTAAHLHFELGTSEKKSDATAVDPCPYLPNAPVECEQPSHRQTGYEVDIPLPGGKKGEVELVVWE